MKKLTLTVSVFLFALLVGAGIAVSLAENASACICEGPFTVVLSCDTGPNCTNPSYPYYAYSQGSCAGHSCLVFTSCHNGIKAGC